MTPMLQGIPKAENQPFAKGVRSELSLGESEGVCQAKEGTTGHKVKGTTCVVNHLFILGCLS